MAGFTPSAKKLSDFNNGNKYVNGVDTPTADDFNNVIESQLYTQALATNQPDTTDAGKVGTPTVEIIQSANGTPRLKFSNLKGEKGVDGTDHSTEISDLYAKVSKISNEQIQQNTSIEENKRQINTVKQVMLQNEEIVMLPIEEKYTVRKTANGANIFDEQYTPVVKVEGSTVKNGSELKHAYFGGIKSTGRNLIPYPYFETTKTINGVTFTDNGDGSITINGTNDGSGNSVFYLTTNTVLQAGTYIGSMGTTEPMNFILYDGTNYYDTRNTTYTIDSQKHINSMYIQIPKGSTTVYNNVKVYPMFNFGETSLPFEPYEEDTLELPQTLELGEWDSFNPQTGELVKGTEIVEFYDSEDQWILGSNVFGVYFECYRPGLNSTSIISNKFQGGKPEISGTPCMYTLPRGAIVVFPNADKNNPTITTVDEWKAKLAEWKAAGTPLTVAYKSATPTVVTIANVPNSYKVWKDGLETIIQGENDNSAYGAMPKVAQTYLAKIGGNE